MKQLIVIILVLFLYPFRADAIKTCHCGSHAEGMTTWNVDDGQPCCKGIYSGTDAGNGVVRTFAMGYDGVWYQTQLTSISNTTAQNNCCD